MKYLNKERYHIKIIKKLSVELGFDALFLSDDWVIRLQKDDTVHHVYGYDWGINSATAQLIAKDKAATYEILSENKIKAVEHKLFFNYGILAGYIGRNGCWGDIMDYVQRHKKGDDYNVICKPNKGTGGNDLYKISNQMELESTVQKMFSKYRDLCLCPFYEIEGEYRAVFLNGEVILLYLKDRPFVVGNGKDTFAKLVMDGYGEKGIKYLESMSNDLAVIVPRDEKRTVSWKHNLGNGAKAIITEDVGIKSDLSKLARRVADSLDIKLASIDIAVVHGEYYVMEVNSGIMIENFAAQAPDVMYNYYEITEDIYRKILAYLFK